MNIEFEATFTDINKDEMRAKLSSVGAKLIRAEYLQKRFVFTLPKGHEIQGGWLRVRDEGDKITMSLKVVSGNKIEDQKEICLTVNDFNEAVLFLQSIGCIQKAYQESKRELWMLDDVEITIDEWPFLEPFVEIEGKSEKEVEDVSKKLGFDFSKAIFATADKLYVEKYGIEPGVINEKTPVLKFGDKNPFIE